LGERLKQIGRDEKEPVIRALGRIGCAEYVPSLAAGGAARRDGDPPSETEIASGAMGLVRREFSSGWYGYGG
jgi:hypothetical protein